MGLGKAIVAVAGMMAVASGCAGTSEVPARNPDDRLRILAVDFDATSRRAVFEVCRVGEPQVGERDRVCQLGWANVGTGGALLLKAVAREPDVQYASAVLVPGGSAVYASRRSIAQWHARLYDSPSQIVRIDLQTGAETEVASAKSGLLTLVDVIQESDGSESLVLLETRESATPQRPADGSQFRTMQFRAGTVVQGAGQVIGDVGGAGYEMRVQGYGYLRQADDRRDGRQPAMFAVRAGDVPTGLYQVVDTLESAVRYVTGCGGQDCASIVQRRAHQVAQRLTPQLRSGGYGPEAVVASFDGHEPVDEVSRSRMAASFTVGFDLSGGAVAVPRGPQPDPGRIPYVVLGGEDIPFRPRTSGLIEAGAFAHGWF